MPTVEASGLTYFLKVSLEIILTEYFGDVKDMLIKRLGNIDCYVIPRPILVDPQHLQYIPLPRHLDGHGHAEDPLSPNGTVADIREGPASPRRTLLDLLSF
jgi:hypothetical protein